MALDRMGSFCASGWLALCATGSPSPDLQAGAAPVCGVASPLVCWLRVAGLAGRGCLRRRKLGSDAFRSWRGQTGRRLSRTLSEGSNASLSSRPAKADEQAVEEDSPDRLRSRPWKQQVGFASQVCRIAAAALVDEGLCRRSVA